MSIGELTDATVWSGPTTRVPDCPAEVDADFFRFREWGWHSGSCRAVDHSFAVAVESSIDVAPLIDSVTRPLRTHDDNCLRVQYRVVRNHNPNLRYALYYGMTRLTLTHSPDVVLRYLTWHINQSMIDQSTRRHVVLHAAAAVRGGVTVVLPGDQEYGKTTTVAGLLQEGYDYVTDEAVAIDPGTLRITPFPKALSLDEGSWPMFPWCQPTTALQATRQWQVPAERLGSRALSRSVSPPRVLIFPRFVAGSTTVATSMTRAEAVRELALATFHFRREPARNLRTFKALVCSASFARLQIGSLDQAVLAVEEIVSQRIMKGIESDY